MKPFHLAVAQLPITGDARKNGRKVRAVMRQAVAKGVRMVQFPEGMLSGYAKNPIMSWDEVDWVVVREELGAVAALAAELKVWVVLGSAHPLTPPHRPHNSLYIISDGGEIVDRYDKRYLSHTEVTRFYTPGTQAVVFEVDGFRFGCVICVEVNFPALFIAYDQMAVDCVLLSAYPVDEIFYTKARAYAAIHNYWVGLSVSSECGDLMMSGLIGPDGEQYAQMKVQEGFVVCELNRDAPELDIAINRARIWRAAANADGYYSSRQVDDPQSSDKTCC